MSPAVAILAYRPEDLSSQRYRAGGEPDTDILLGLMDAVRAHADGVTGTALRDEMAMSQTALTSLVHLLEEAGGVQCGAEGVIHVVPGARRDTCAKEAARIAASRVQLERSRLEMMRAYAETTGCRRRHLLGYFGELLGKDNCASCDVCTPASPSTPSSEQHQGVLAGTGTTSPPKERSDEVFLPGTQVHHKSWGEGEIMSQEEDRVTVLFASAGYRTLSLSAVHDHGLLSLTAKNAEGGAKTSA